MGTQSPNPREPSLSPRERLDSWKEIAAYLNCSERTVRRWEKEGLPVRRHVHKSKAAIYAYKAEIDAWWQAGHQHLKQVDDPAELTPAFWKQPWLVAGVALAAIVIALAWTMSGWRGGSLGRSSSPHMESLAVLPLQNLSHDPEQEYFADGMTEELTARLAQISALRVISRTSAMRYKGTRESSPQIARALGADALIEGSVRREGDRVEITVELIEAKSDRHLWAQAYQRDVHGVLALQGSVASAIAAEVQAKLTPAERVRLRETRTVDANAYASYLKGRYFFGRWNADGRRKALDYFRQAVAQDSRFAAAYSGLADTLAMRSYLNESTGPEERTMAISAANEALSLDNSFAEAHAALGFVSMIDLRWADAERELHSAVSLNPNCPICHVWSAYFLTFTSHFSEAAEEMKKAQTLDPLSSMTYVASGVMRYFSRDFNEANIQYQKAIELDTANPEAYKNLADVYLETENCSEATRQFVHAEQLLGQLRNASSLAKAFASSGCRGMLSKQLQFYSDRANPDYYPMYAAANAALLEKKEEAFKFLEEAYEKRQGIIELPVEPELDNLRSDPRYADLLRRLSLPKSADKT
jgi:TolB-like protein/Tfp pilus assembly protein PilF